jgi:acyl carrier protein
LPLTNCRYKSLTFIRKQICAMTTDILAALTKIVRETLENPTIELERSTTARDVPGWDSLRMVLIALAVEEQLGVILRTVELDRLSSVGEFVDLIAAKQGAPQGFRLKR